MIGGNMKYFFRLILAVSIIFCFHYNALGADHQKIGVVDIQELQTKSKVFQRERAKLKKTFDAMQKKLDEEKTALLKLEEDFRKQSMMLSLDAKEDKKRELEKKRRYYKYLFEDFTQEMKDAETQATKKTFKELEKVVDKIAVDEGYIIILEKRTPGLIFYNDAIDITDHVAEAYDKMPQK